MLKRVLCVVLCLCLLCAVLPTAFATQVGDIYTPDTAKWGTQDNNGWYYLYKDTNGEYHEMSYYDDTSSIDWQKNAFASDPYTMYEMFFINSSSFFVGENGSRPVYAFKAPKGGTVRLTVQTHGIDNAYMELFRNDEQLRLGADEQLSFTTAGTLPGGFTATQVTVEVKQNTMLYLVGGVKDQNVARAGWCNLVSAEYLSVNDEVDYTAVTYAPDLSAWGTQNNNGWYYKYKDCNTGLYENLDYYDASAAIDWQREHFAFDPARMNEMLFVDQSHYFTGENGSVPVYAFQAPASGELKISFEIHGLASMGVSAYVGDKLVPIEGKDRYTFCTTGSLPGAFTAVSFTTKVEKDDMVYLVCSSTDAGIRDGWFRNQRAKYIETVPEIDYTQVTLTPDMALWGASSNQGWQYMVRSTDGLYEPLTYYDDAATSISWQKDTYSFDPVERVEMLFISKTNFFVGENGSRPVYAFKAPIGGTVTFTIQTHGYSQLYMEVYKNTELQTIEGDKRISFTTIGPLPGGFTAHSITLEVKKNTMVYFVGGSDDISAQRGGYVNYYEAKYASVNDEVEEVVPVVVPKVEGSALQWNQEQAYMTALKQKLSSDEAMTWLFVGDSITANDGDVSRGYRSYAEMMEGFIKTSLERRNDRVVNTAVSGWGVRDINYDRDIAAYAPDVVCVCIGTNNSFMSDYAAATFKTTLRLLYEKIIASGAIPVIFCENGFSAAWGNADQTAAFAQRYPTVIRELAYEKKLLLVDVFGTYADNAELANSLFFCPDTIHPSRFGYTAYTYSILRDLALSDTPLSGLLEKVQNAEKDGTLLFPNLDVQEYITDGTAITLAQLSEAVKNGFVLAGGSNAVGTSSELFCTRAIAQYLNNNNQKGRNVTRYLSLSEAQALDWSEIANSQTLLLLPEVAGADGEDLWAGATAEQLGAIAEQSGAKVLLLTPPYAADAETAALAETVKAAAVKYKLPLVDLYSYFKAAAEKEPGILSKWYDDAGVLNYAGANEAALVLGTALGLNTISYSDNRFVEEFYTDDWGKQGSNGFYYLYQAKTGGNYQELPYLGTTPAESWLRNRFGLAVGEFTFIGKDVLHAGANYNPVKAFKAPFTGTVTVTLKTRRGEADVSEGGSKGTMWLKAYQNETALTLDDGKSQVALLAAGGCYTNHTLTAQVKAGDMLYVVVDAEQPGQADVLETVTYTDAEKAISYEVTFVDGLSGGTIDTQSVEEGKAATAPTVPEHEGYTFTGWDKAFDNITVALTVTAQYEKTPWINPFSDVDSSKWYYSGVAFASENKLFYGTTDTTFDPEGSMTRAMLVTVLYRLDGEEEQTGMHIFTDVPTDEKCWYRDAVTWASANGIVAGVGGGKFAPDDKITREQMAVFFYNYAVYKKCDTTKTAHLTTFPDYAQIGSWARKGLSWANAEGLIAGAKVSGVSYLQPKGNATRSQVAAILMRFVGNIISD